MEKINVLKIVENKLINKYKKRGLLLKDEVRDCCKRYGLDPTVIDTVCNRLSKRNIIIKYPVSDMIKIDNDFVKYCRRTDYDTIYDAIKKDFPVYESLIEQIRTMNPPRNKEWKRLIKQAQDGNKNTKERLELMYLHTALKYAYVFSKMYFCDFEDCFQNAVIGLIYAINNYDANTSGNFAPYYQLCVYKAMQKYCDIKGTVFCFPDQIKKRFLMASKKLNKINMSLGHIADKEQSIIEETCTEEYGSSKGIYDKLNKNFELLYKDKMSEILKKKTDQNYILPYLPILDDLTYNNNDNELIKIAISIDMKRLLRKFMDICLTDEEKSLILIRYGFNSGIPKSLGELGCRIGVSRERVRQIESNAFRKIKKYARFFE